MKASATVGFAGMTHLGLVSSSAIAARGFKTVCFDGDVDLISRLQAGTLPIREPDLDDLIAGNAGRQTFTSDLRDLSACDIVYISIDVPTDDNARSDLRPIDDIVRRVIPALNPTALLVILCQVPPGYTRSISRIEPNRLYYQVETLVFGRAVERAIHPERYILGCASPKAAVDSRLVELLSSFGCPILPMRYESAELAKIAINCCLVAMISVSNTLAELSEEIGADWSEIVPALRLDERIGRKAYLSPGLGIAGGNLERDLQTIIGLSVAHETDAAIVAAMVSNSRHRKGWAARLVRKTVPAGSKLAVWGLAYKENTHSVKNSPSLATLAELQDYPLAVHDPAVSVSAVDHPRAEGARLPLDALRHAEALLILTPWPIYRTISAAEIASALGGRTVFDPYRVLDGGEARRYGLQYHTLGVGSAGVLA